MIGSVYAGVLSCALAAGSMTIAGCGVRGPAAVVGASSPVIAAPARTTARAPRFFADTIDFAAGSGAFQVRYSATGKLVTQDKRIRTGVEAIAGTGGRGFVVALPAGNFPGGSCASRLYRLRLNGSGVPGRLAPLGPKMRGRIWSVAASAGGEVIGYAISGCAKGEPGHIRVLHVRDGRTRQWGDVDLGGVSPGTVALSGGLSMSANGRLLAFTGWNVTAAGRSTRQVVRVLATSAPRGTVAARSRVVLRRPLVQPSLLAATLSPDGSSFYLCTVSTTGAKRVTRVGAYRTATGARRRAVATLRGTGSLAGCPMALDTPGRFLLVPYSLQPQGTTARTVVDVARIDVTTRAVVRLRLTLPANAGMDPFTGITPAW